MLRVIDLTTLSGAYAARLFAEEGHEVIRVEPSEGDELRRLAPFLKEQHDLEHGAFHQFLNAGKKSVTLDLKSPKGQKSLLDLLGEADVLLVNSPPPSGESACLAANPQLVLTKIVDDAPELCAVARSGLMSLTGHPDQPPVTLGGHIPLMAVATYVAVATAAALLARNGFFGPRTVFEGVHGLYFGFAHTLKGNYEALIGEFGTRWVTETLAFKPYPCGTMTHPYIDCARRLAAMGIKAVDIKEMVCEVGEGTVHRLWEPLAAKQKPQNGYAGKFSTPYCIAAGFVRGNVGLGDFSDDAVRDPAVVALAGKVRYQIDPNNPYPRNFTGHIRATLNDGRVVEERQPHMRGGAHEPLTRGDIEEKFVLNAHHGGWDAARTQSALALMRALFDGKIDLSSLRA